MKPVTHEGYYWNATAKNCTRCPDGCRACDSTTLACTECTRTVLDTKTGTCPSCSVKDCVSCSEALDTCEECVEGFRLDGNKCQPCTVANCTDW